MVWSRRIRGSWIPRTRRSSGRCSTTIASRSSSLWRVDLGLAGFDIVTDTEEHRLITVECPHCSSRYRLPLNLLGPGGARVHCPACGESFVVSPDGDPVEAAGTPSIPPSAPETAATTHAEARGSVGGAKPVESPDPVLAMPAGEGGAPNASDDRRNGGSSPDDLEATAPAEPKAVTDTEAGFETWSESIIARAVVEPLVPHASSLREAQARGRLLAEAGPLLLEVFDDYRRRAGPRARIAAFHDALRAALGIELPTAGT